MSFDFLNEVFKLNPYASIADNGVIAGDFDGFMDSGSYSLNAVLSGSIYGGYAMNKITELAGPSSVGKTFFLLSLIKLFLEKNPAGGVFFFESESAISRKQLIEFKIDVKRVFIFPVDTVEKFRHQASVILNNYNAQKEKERQPMLMCLDSLGMLSTEKEISDVAEGKNTRDMTRTQLIKGAFRVLTLKLGLAGVPLIMTNHTYQTMDMFSKTVASGGTGRAYAASSTVFLSKRKEKEGKEVIGNVVHAKMEKGRITKENSMADTIIRYDSGLDRWYGMVDFAIEAGVWSKSGSRIDIGGTKLYQKKIYENPEKFFTDEIMKSIDAHVGRKFLYGSAFSDEDIEELEEGIEVPGEELPGVMSHLANEEG